jgi:leucyl-tRNA synthetase
MVTHRTFKNDKNEWIEPKEIINNKDKLFDSVGNPISSGSIEKMSKSKKNVIDPDEIIELYGADTARWFMLSDSPPERDLEWTERGVVSSYKFINKIWDLVEKSKSYKSASKKSTKSFLESFDQIINDISLNVEGLHFNKSVAKIYEYVNLLGSLIAKKTVDEKELQQIIKNLTIVIHPFIPHISEEIWHQIESSGLCATASWPKTKNNYEIKMLKLPIQINGKTRSLVDVDKDEEKNDIMKKVMKDPKIMKNTKDKQIIKTIFVKNKIVNLVVK